MLNDGVSDSYNRINLVVGIQNDSWRWHVTDVYNGNETQSTCLLYEQSSRGVYADGGDDQFDTRAPIQHRDEPCSY